jgi:hypothetical protein
MTTTLPAGMNRTVLCRRSHPARLKKKFTFAGYAAGRVIGVAVIEDPAAAEARVTRRARLLAELAELRSAL